jgi:hypothetical protein
VERTTTVLELQHEVLLGVEGDPTPCQGTRDQGQKNDSSAQHGQRRRVIEKNFLVATNYLFTSTTTRQVTNNHAPVREAWRELTAL